MGIRKLGRPHWAAVLTLGLAITLTPFSYGDESAASTLEFSERVVAGDSADFMTVRHMRLRGTQREIGKKLAEITHVRHGQPAARVGATQARKRSEFYRDV